MGSGVTAGRRVRWSEIGLKRQHINNLTTINALITVIITAVVVVIIIVIVVTVDFGVAIPQTRNCVDGGMCVQIAVADTFVPAVQPPCTRTRSRRRGDRD